MYPRHTFFPASAGHFILRLALLIVALLFVGMAMAQVPQYTGSTSTVDSIPQITVVPVQQPPTQLVEHTTVYEKPTDGMSRPERRAYRAKCFAAKIDSLIQSRNYLFFPNSMQEIPNGTIRTIYADYYFFGLFVDHVEVHLPTERGVSQYIEMLNFDSMTIRDYRASRTQWGWTVSFNITDQDDLYHVNLATCAATGEAVLTLITPSLTMRYVGTLIHKPHGHKKFHPTM